MLFINCWLTGRFPAAGPWTFNPPPLRSWAHLVKTLAHRVKIVAIKSHRRHRHQHSARPTRSIQL